MSSFPEPMVEQKTLTWNNGLSSSYFLVNQPKRNREAGVGKKEEGGVGGFDVDEENSSMHITWRREEMTTNLKGLLLESVIE